MSDTDARAEALERYPFEDPQTGVRSPGNWDRRGGFVAGAEWQASRPVTDAEVKVAAKIIEADRLLDPPFSAEEVARAALEAARGVRSW